MMILRIFPLFTPRTLMLLLCALVHHIRSQSIATTSPLSMEHHLLLSRHIDLNCVCTWKLFDCLESIKKENSRDFNAILPNSRVDKCAYVSLFEISATQPDRCFGSLQDGSSWFRDVPKLLNFGVRTPVMSQLNELCFLLKTLLFSKVLLPLSK